MSPHSFLARVETAIFQTVNCCQMCKASNPWPTFSWLRTWSCSQSSCLRPPASNWQSKCSLKCTDISHPTTQWCCSVCAFRCSATASCFYWLSYCSTSSQLAHQSPAKTVSSISTKRFILRILHCWPCSFWDAIGSLWPWGLGSSMLWLLPSFSGSSKMEAK